MVNPSGQAVLIDFGLAEVPSSASHAVGTPYYIAPEVFFPRVPPDARADVYSLSATLYRLLSGQPPHFQHCLHPGWYRGARAELDALRFRIADAASECDVEELRREVPREFCKLVIRGLSANPDQRPSSADGFRTALEEIQAKLFEARGIERELWALADILLEAIRSISLDPAYASREQENASIIRDDIRQALRCFSALLQLQQNPESWAGFISDFAIIVRTIKIVSKVNAACEQIDAFLNSPGVGTNSWNNLLHTLVARTLESIRSISVDTIAAAHDWCTLLVQLGLLEGDSTTQATIKNSSDSISSTC